MKMNPEPNDTFLSDWLAGKISDEQLRQIVSEADFKAYLQLRKSLESYSVTETDMDANYAAIKSKRIADNNRKPTRVFPWYRWTAVAAMLLLLFGLHQLLVFSNTVAADFGKTMSIRLSDNSKVILNAKSDVSFPSLFSYNRKIKLHGEAFFEVSKGSTFTVETPQGEVQVLGTQFNVVSRPGFFEVVCFEGRVKVCQAQSEIILSRGEAIRFYRNTAETWQVNEPRPLWISGESSIRNLPLQLVISQLENQYMRKLEYPKALEQVRFTGSFTHHNLETALQSVCIPLHLKYSITDSGKIILSE
jgi:transmembrane sensor